MPNMQCKRLPPTALRIDTPVQNPQITIALGDSSALSSAASESDYSPSNALPKARSLRNMKKLSLTLPMAQSSSNSLSLAPSESQSALSPTNPEPFGPERLRRPSVISLPSSANPATTSFLHRKDEDGSPSLPYADGPVQVVPGVWLGSEDNARDWHCLLERGIKSILNVAQEVASPFDSAAARSSRRFSSTPNLKTAAKETVPTYYPSHLASGRPSMHYLKLQWSHGQHDLVEQGFPAAMAFTDAALERGEGVLVHCQCGISRSATMVIALVMRAAAQSSASVPPEVRALKGYQGAYSFVKEKSRWVGPNMSLIYQLLEYERTLKPSSISPVSSNELSVVADEEEEWGRRRQALEEVPSDHGDDERESSEVRLEAQALDKAMEERVVARKSSASSASSGVGMGAAWRSRYSSRKRAGSVTSNLTNTSTISEDLVEEEEEQELLGVGGGFDEASVRLRTSSEDGSSSSISPEDFAGDSSQAESPYTPHTVQPKKLFAHHTSPSCLQTTAKPPPSEPVWQTSFNLHLPPASAVRPAFNLPPPQQIKAKRRPAPLDVLSSMPSPPITLALEPAAPAVSTRQRTVSRKPIPPPLHMCSTLRATAPSFKPRDQQAFAPVSTPSQTLFVFPAESSLTARTPSTMTLTMSGSIPFPSMTTPRVSTFRSHGRTKSFIGLGAPPSSTTACSRVDARGWVGVE